MRLLMGHPASSACLSTSTIPQSPVAILKLPTPSDRNWGSALRLGGKLNLVQSQDVWTPHLSAYNFRVSWAGDLWLRQSNLWRVDKEQFVPVEDRGDLSMGLSVSAGCPWNQPKQSHGLHPPEVPPLVEVTGVRCKHVVNAFTLRKLEIGMCF